MDNIKYLGVNIEDKSDIFGRYVKDKISKSLKYKFWVGRLLSGKIYKAALGKVFWKSAVLPSILHGAQACTWKENQIKQVDTLQTGIMKSLLNLPVRTAGCYVRGEIGISQHKFRDVKLKLGLLQHIVQNTEHLKNLILAEWDRGHRWIDRCKLYLDRIGLSVDDIEEMSKTKLKIVVNKIETLEWRNDMMTKSTLFYYRKVKTQIKQDRYWINNDRGKDN